MKIDCISSNQKTNKVKQVGLNILLLLEKLAEILQPW